MTDARCEPPEEWRDGVARAVHDGMGDGWAYTNYAGDEWRTNRDMLNAAAVSVWKHLASERAALRAERDAAVEARDIYTAAVKLADNEIATLRAEVEKLKRLLEECANDLAMEIDSRYPNAGQHPSEAKRRDRDMEIVNLARAATLANAVEVPE